jgi:hypothetical protein
MPKLSTACLNKTDDMVKISSDGRLKYVTEDTFKPEPKATQDVAQIIDIGSLPKSVEKLNKAGFRLCTHARTVMNSFYFNLCTQARTVMISFYFRLWTHA